MFIDSMPSVIPEKNACVVKINLVVEEQQI